jgi:predicted RNase H-like HicB family nuclease
VVYELDMNELRAYQTAALKLAVIEPMNDADGYSATIPGFNGLIVFGVTIKETKKELASVLEGWIAVALKLGDGLPEVRRRKAALATTH